MIRVIVHADRADDNSVSLVNEAGRVVAIGCLAMPTMPSDLVISEGQRFEAQPVFVGVGTGR